MDRPRIGVLDSLRGLGVLGILLCNAPDFAVAPAWAESARQWPHGTGAATLAVWGVTQALFQRKFVSLFALLFGASIFLVGGDGADPGRGAILRRRLAWLAGFGLLHGFVIWYGDILLSYALAGFVVMGARGWPAARLLRTGIGLWAALALLTLVGILAGPVEPPAAAGAAAARALAESAAAAR